MKNMINTLFSCKNGNKNIVIVNQIDYKMLINKFDSNSNKIK